MKKFRIIDNDHTATPATGQAAQGKQSKGKAETKTVSVKLPGDLYAQLLEIKEAGGYKSVYEILQLLIVCFTRHVERTRQARQQPPPEPPDPMAEEIAAMFADLAQAEPTPEAGATPKVHKPRKRILYE